MKDDSTLTVLSDKIAELKSAVSYSVRARKHFFFAISLSIASFIFTMRLNSLYVLPPGTDPGLWLRYSRALMGDMGSFWPWDPQVNPLQYPPLTFIILTGLIKLLGNEILAVKLLGSLALSLVPLTTYFVAKKTLRNKTRATIACVFVAFFSAFFEMWGWGAYPNLLGLSLLSVTLYFLLSVISEPHKKDVLIATVTAIATVYTHHLAGVVLLSSIALYTFFLIIRSWRKEERSISIKPIAASILIIAITVVSSIPLVIVGMETFALSNMAAKAFIIGPDIIVFLFKSIWLLLLIVAPAMVYLVSLALKKASGQNVLLPLTWLIAPLFLTQLYIVGIYVDFNRFLFFSIQPLLIILAGSYGNFNLKIRFGEKFVSIFLILLLITSSIIGVTTAIGSNEYYHYIITGEVTPFSDQDIYEAISWIKDNTENNKTILTSAYLGIWTRAIANVRALFPEQTKFQFVTKLIELNMDAETMLTSLYEARNAYFQVRKAVLNSGCDLSARVFNEGEYKDAIHLHDSKIGIELSNSSGKSYTILLNNTNINSIEATNHDEFVRISTFHSTQAVSVNKTIELHQDSQEVKLFLNVSSLDGSEIKISKIWMTFQTATSFSIIDVKVKEQEPVVLINGEPSAIQVVLSAQNLTNINLEEKGSWFISAFYNLTKTTEQMSINVTLQSDASQQAPREILGEGLVCLRSREDLLKKYNVEYVALMHFDPYLKSIESDPRFEPVPYANTKVKFFSLKG